MAQQPDDSGGKSWERPWSTEEMRKNAEKWNLAADAGLLKHLQEFSQVVLSHTHSTEKALDSLLETLNTTNSNINNVTNDFLCLANTQFLESRVYDDDESPQEVPLPDSKQVPQVDGDLMTKVRSALSVGITLLDTMFEPVDQSNLNLDNDYLAGGRNRSPKNPYLARPLPHLIGSPAFMADDNVGLVHSEKENELPSSKAPTMDDLSMYSDESILTTSLKRNMDDDSSNTSFCLGDDTPVQNNKFSRDAISITGPENDAVPEERSFADELAGKLAGMVSPENRVPALTQGEQSYEEPVSQTRPSKTRGDMFGVPHSDDEDDALFSGRSGLFSGGRGLFDDIDNAAIPKEVAKDKSITSQTPRPPPVSKPKRDSDLFGSISADEESDDLFAVPAKKELAKPVKPPDVKPRPLSIGDVISQAPRRNMHAPVPVSGEEGLPGKSAETVVPDDVPPPITAEKKIPTGGRSMFGSAGLAIPKEAPSSSSSEGSNDAAKDDKIVPNSGGDLFSACFADEDDLFRPSAPSVQSSARPFASRRVEDNPLPKSKTGVREHAPESPVEDEDLFATPKGGAASFKSAEADKSARSAPKTSSSAGLFDAGGSSDEDNLFKPKPLAKQSLFSAIPPPLTKSEEKSKKVSLFDDSDSGDDEFLFSSASSAGSRRSQASVDVFNSASVPSLIDKKPLRKGLFDDDNLFSSQLDGPDIDIFRGVGNDSGLRATESVTPVSTTGSAVPSNVTSSGSAVPSNVTSSGSAVPFNVTSSVSAAASTAAKAISSSDVTGATAVTSSGDSAGPAVLTSATRAAVTVPSGAISAVTTTGSTVSSPAVPIVAPAQSSLLKPNSIGGTLFDDDEDLFSVESKPQPPQKSVAKETSPINKFSAAISEDLFSGLGDESKNVNSRNDDLFGNPPEDDLFADKSTPKIVNKYPKVPVDDLFGTDEGDGDIFVPRKPTLTISDSIVGNKSLETKTEVFAAVDVPNKTESIIEKKNDLKPDLKPRPPRTLDIRNETDPTIASSFDDEDSEDLFKSIETKPPVQPEITVEIPVEKGQQKTSQRDEPQTAEQAQSQPVEKAQSVSVEKDQTAPAVPEKPPKPVPTARKPSVLTSEKKGAAEKPQHPEALPKPAARTSPRKDEDAVPVSTEISAPAAGPPPIKARTPLAGLGLNINPLALLPGAQPPSKKTPGEEPVGFDQPMENSSTLHSAQKERVRVSKRRPPSRRARQEAAKNVDHTGVDIVSPMSVLSPSTDEDDLFGVPQDLAPDSGPFDGPFDGAPILSPADPKTSAAVPETLDSATVDDPLLKMRAETPSETDTDADVTEDHSSLFEFVKKKPKEAQSESLFSQAPTLPTKEDVEKVINDVTDDDVEDDDLFKTPAAVKKITDLGSGTRTWKLSDDEDDDDLFTTGVSSLKGGITNSSKEMPKEVRKEEKKAALKSEPLGASKSDSRSGLFSQLASKKTDRPLFDDDDLDDDFLFSTAPSKTPPFPVLKGPAEVKKKSTNPPQFKDDLFDDPLSGR